MGELGAVDALTRLGGIADTPAVIALSSRKRVRVAIAKHQILRVSHNRLALPTAERGLEPARAVGGFVSHLTGAAHHGWKIKDPPEFPQVMVPRGVAIPEHPDLMIDLVRRELLTEDRDGWATSPLRTVLDCAADLPFDAALSVADSAIRAGALTQEELRSAAAPLRGARGNRVRRVAAYADGRSANPFESTLKALCLQAGLEVVPQYAVRCGDREYHPDFANPLVGVIVEADSYEFHGRRPWDHNRDCRRYNDFVTAGWRVLRFTWEQVMLNPDHVVATIRAVLTAVA